MSATKRALEEALTADFGDRVSHAAYADLLQEAGNPHGEFIAVQLALEDDRLSPPERRDLQTRERELLAAHGREWLGRLSHYIGAVPREGQNPPEISLRFTRGWLEAVQVRRANYREMESLGQAPLARFLQALEIDYGYETPDDWDEERQEVFPPPPIPSDTPQENEFYLAIREAPFLANLRAFRIGEIRGGGEPYWWFCSSGRADLLATVLARTPRLEELHMLNSTRGAPRFDPAPIFRLPLPNLRVLRAYNLFDHASAALAANASLQGLTHLMFHSHADDPCFDRRAPYLTLTDLRNVLRSEHLKGLTHLQFRLSDVGDEGCVAIARSGALKRLKHLDLRHGRVTDEGVRRLVGCRDLRNLTWLDVSRNAVTAGGVAMLNESGVPFSADGPHAAGDTDWHREGDWE